MLFQCDLKKQVTRLFFQNTFLYEITTAIIVVIVAPVNIARRMIDGPRINYITIRLIVNNTINYNNNILHVSCSKYLYILLYTPQKQEMSN